jgi:hypothetical protein
VINYGVSTAMPVWGGGLFVLSEPLRFVIAFSESWQAFARALMN